MRLMIDTQAVALLASLRWRRVRSRLIVRLWLGTVLTLGLCSVAGAEDVLFENVRIFDGKNSTLSGPSNVLVKGKVIERVSDAPIDGTQALCAFAGNGRTLMPGLIDDALARDAGAADARTVASVTSAITISWPAPRRPTR